MPNHKFINGDFMPDTAIKMLDRLYEPGAAWWVCLPRIWDWINELMAPTALDWGRHQGLAEAHAKYDIKAITPMHETEPVGYLFCAHSDGRASTVSVRSPQTLDAWGLSEMPPYLLGQVMAEYEKALGVWISGAPSTTGLRMLEAQAGQVARPIDLSPFQKNHAQEFIWTRELTTEEKTMPYLHGFDKRTAYLCASDIDLGVGEWVNVSGASSPGSIDFDKQAPGLWRVEFVDDSLREPHGCTLNGLPWPYTSRTGWYYTPMVALFNKLGLPGQIVEAYVFPQRRRVLNKWSKTLTKVIKRLSDIDADRHAHANDQLIARAVIRMAKRTFRTSIGLLGAIHRKDKSEWSYRPDWRGMIVSESAARIYYGMLRARDLCGQTPAAVYMDCLYYPSNYENPVALPFLTDEQLRNGYHYEATYDLTQPGAQELFRSDGRRLNFAENIKQFQILP